MPAELLTPVLDVSPEKNGFTRRVSMSYGNPVSPLMMSANSLSQSQGYLGSPISRTGTGPTFAKPLKPFATEDIKILLLENVNETGRSILTAQGYQVEALQSSLPEDELINKIRWGSSSPVLDWKHLD